MSTSDAHERCSRAKRVVGSGVFFHIDVSLMVSVLWYERVIGVLSLIVSLRVFSCIVIPHDVTPSVLRLSHLSVIPAVLSYIVVPHVPHSHYSHSVIPDDLSLLSVLTHVRPDMFTHNVIPDDVTPSVLTYSHTHTLT